MFRVGKLWGILRENAKTDGPSGHPSWVFQSSRRIWPKHLLDSTFGETNLSFELTCTYIVHFRIPIASIYGIFTYISHLNYANVNKYTIHGWYGIESIHAWICFLGVILLNGLYHGIHHHRTSIWEDIVGTFSNHPASKSNVYVHLVVLTEFWIPSALRIHTLPDLR